MLARPKQGQVASRTNTTKKGSEPWQPSTSEMQHIIFDYGVQMKPAQFKSNVSKIALSLGESLKYGGPEVKEAVRSGVPPTLTKPTKPTLEMVDGEMQKEINIIKEMETCKVEISQYLKNKKQYTINNK